MTICLMSTADGLPQHTRAFSLHCDHYFLKVIYFYIIQKDKQNNGSQLKSGI
jgi:hypothetical protein